MAPLASYPEKPAKAETNGYDKLKAYDAVVEANIEEVYTTAQGKVNQTETAGLNVIGWAPTVFIPPDGTVPAETPPRAVVIEDL